MAGGPRAGAGGGSRRPTPTGRSAQRRWRGWDDRRRHDGALRSGDARRTARSAGRRCSRAGGATGSDRRRPPAGSPGDPQGNPSSGRHRMVAPHPVIRGRAGRPGVDALRTSATPYSTSYDAADEEPFEPGWSGATWYGASSGTYWTINPEGICRSRGSMGRNTSGEPGDGPAAGSSTSDGEPGSGQPEPSDRDGQGRRVARRRGADRGAERGARCGNRGPGRRTPGPKRGPPDIPCGPVVATCAAAPVDARRAAAPARPGTAVPRSTASTGFQRPTPAHGVDTDRPARDGAARRGRHSRVAIAAAIGEETGCGRFAASCGEAVLTRNLGRPGGDPVCCSSPCHGSRVVRTRHAGDGGARRRRLRSC